MHAWFDARRGVQTQFCDGLGPGERARGMGTLPETIFLENVWRMSIDRAIAVNVRLGLGSTALPHDVVRLIAKMLTLRRRAIDYCAHSDTFLYETI